MIIQFDVEEKPKQTDSNDPFIHPSSQPASHPLSWELLLYSIQVACHSVQNNNTSQWASILDDECVPILEDSRVCVCRISRCAHRIPQERFVVPLEMEPDFQRPFNPRPDSLGFRAIPSNREQQVQL